MKNDRIKKAINESKTITAELEKSLIIVVEDYEKKGIDEYIAMDLPECVYLHKLIDAYKGWECFLKEIYLELGNE